MRVRDNSYIQEATIKIYSEPKLRADMERALEMWGDTQPVRSAYWRAILDGDVYTAQKIQLHKKIFQYKEKARTRPAFAGYVEYLLTKDKVLDFKRKVVTK